jgi:hypothetical protein
MTHADLWKLAPELFDGDYAFEPNYEIPSKLENAYAEYFQITLFLILERLKKDKSFWHPYFQSLPQSNQTLFTISNNEKIKFGSNINLIDEIQRADDDIYYKIKYD